MSRQIATGWQRPSVTELEMRIRRLEEQVEHLMVTVEELRRAAKAPADPVR
ncbi:hypothetical protein GCM10010106_04000 [Thermopolyspora flexuosa]|jgi:prefoldin subunit 5|uniref:Uncharacterized protein n=1 Tax=Thermopolyspora flexuosa TaxID=103836 RepID=A0A543IYM5_9ACTN|nr:hypothetical protein [Thermopolyspora flexuosa]TQM75685.1 hypothetical protein FHX40_2402 [Thermopolyspora flexuosa]GGM61250.1 hypothetical protein GCM10010106_04000 [Thermopolyspora flexuosa]